MAKIHIEGAGMKIRHLRQRPSGWYFVPSKRMKDTGYSSEALGKDPIRAAARAQELNEQWDRDRTAPKSVKPPHGSLAWLYGEYQASSWYSDVSTAYQYDVERAARLILSSPLGRQEVGAIRRSDCRRLYEAVLAATSREPANKCIKVLRRIFNYGIELELIQTNPAAGMGLKQNPPRKIVWEPEWVDQFIAKAVEMNKPGWAIAVAIGYDTSQRLRQVISALHGQFDGEGISFPAVKGGKAVWAPLEPRTIQLIKSTPRRAVTLVYGDRGTPITQTAYFARIFREIRAAAGIPDHVWFKDLRRTAATEALAGGGRSEALTGHQPNSPILKHYETPSRAAARSAQEARKKGRGENKSGRKS